ncbi:glycine C-acetyltransferase [Anaerolinea thermophila]|uniref:8-amino-7-ketopelargonate synthase n=1 Tax=Anaerolinea thermophila (strain DSM 14523 / JCM 11388 / NBRC 100420 / UNI-1) TaxID=926569 RepID=E8N295_ANATU|nr:glycine C-acetyltransferase [Anaerolinea thermophila]BAJ65042.1 8-amino-7-oxononanoate synthetase [Anaerolinea thermophila UNI-1]
MSERLQWIQDELDRLKESGLYNRIRTISTPQGAWLVVDGKRVLNFCSNNYLGFANHPRLVEKARQALEKYGVGPGAVRTIAGTLDLHTELERRIAAFKGVDAAITFQSGFTANLATIAALVGKEDVVFSDELNHASIIDGCRLSGARIVRYAHADPVDLEARIRENEGTYRRAIAITDGVFSMDGDIAPLDKIYEVTSAYNVMLMVDDAHGEGVLGKGGRGIVDHFNLHGKVDIEIGTFSKAFGVVGGVSAGSPLVVEWLRQRGRPFLFSSATPAADVAACIAAIDVLEESTELVDRLWENARYFKAEMKKLGFDTGVSVTPITPIMLGEAPLAQQFSRELFEEGVFAMAIGYPTVPHGKARIRVMISAAHSKDDLDKGLEAFARVGKRLGVIG